MNIKHQKTRQVLELFEKISAIPRCSKHEEKIGAFLLDWAGKNGLKARKDRVGNVLILVPASPGYEKSPTVVIQGHMDMVCEKTADSPHDFAKDPIRFVFEGEWLKADHTTLGADNGIALAMAMVLALDKSAVHPPLELLFTIDEETGLTGANALQGDFIAGKILLNVDSEDEGVFTVGCAGGRDTHISLPVRYEDAPEGFVMARVKAGGMTGGHSGVNINEERANAIRVLARVLAQVRRQHDARLADISGGTAHNAIPRDAWADIFIPRDSFKAVEKLVAEMEQVCKSEFRKTDPGLKLSAELQLETMGKRPLNTADSGRILDLLIALPHGVAAMSTEMKGLVETSNNEASVRIANSKLEIVTSQRSSVMSRLNALTWRVEAAARLAGADAVSGDGYPAWQPNLQSPLLARCKEVYRRLFGREAHVEAIHAGLECGIIGDKKEGMDMISFGPTLKNPHSPDEKIHVESIGKVWDFMVELLKSLK
ncbi:MAG TPA: aminoacyl-histidine dipeptidase [Candidatus Aminicenantes bacterium]|nr:aminoacyl-histidine dipeptidase [Candidatus Aminicenantes bacterium]